MIPPVTEETIKFPVLIIFYFGTLCEVRFNFSAVNYIIVSYFWYLIMIKTLLHVIN